MADSTFFTEIKFVIGRCHDAEKLSQVLQMNGATLIHYMSEIVTHVIADTTCPEADEAIELYEAAVVTPSWVYQSLFFEVILPTFAFSPFKNYFKGLVIAFSSTLIDEDIKNLAAMTTFHGGSVTKNHEISSHFIVSKDEEKNLPEDEMTKIVTPDWILNSINEGRICNEQYYTPNLLEYPQPKVDTPPCSPIKDESLNTTPPVTITKSSQPQFDTATYPFANCCFKLIEYDDIDAKTKKSWFIAIKLAGGIFSEDLLNVTHLICETRTTATYDDAIKFGVRCITINWINDVIAERDLRKPWKALHLPVAFPPTFKPLAGHIITTTNFKNKERNEVKQMILRAGATYTAYMSYHNTLIVCRIIGGQKYDKAIQWKVPIVNCQFLSDILLSSSADITTMLAQSKYQLFMNDPLKLTSFSSELFDAWKRPIKYPYRKQLPLDKIATTEHNNDNSKKANIKALLSRNSKDIFKDIVFFVTPGVKPSLSIVSKMIELGGGQVATKKLPSKLQIEQIEARKQRFITISCSNDKHLLTNLNSIVLDVEFLITAITQQEVPCIDSFKVG